MTMCLELMLKPKYVSCMVMITGWVGMKAPGGSTIVGTHTSPITVQHEAITGQDSPVGDNTSHLIGRIVVFAISTRVSTVIVTVEVCIAWGPFDVEIFAPVRSGNDETPGEPAKPGKSMLEVAGGKRNF